MDPWFHGEEVCKFIEDVDKTRTHGLLLMPRGHGKTGMVTEPKPAWDLAQNRLNRVIVCNAVDTKAEKMARVSASIIENHSLYKKCFPEIEPGDIWGAKGYFLKDQAQSKDVLSSTVGRTIPSLSSYGVRSNLTGAHANRSMYLDDLINAEMSRHPEQVKLAERFFVEASTNCLDVGGVLLVCCTRWTYHDYAGKLVSGELTGGGGKLKVLKLGATRVNAKGEHELVFPVRTYFDQSNQKQIVGFTKDKLDEAKNNLRGLFSALYYNEPVLTEDQQFDTSLVSTFPNHGSLGFPLGNVKRVVVETASQAASFGKTIMNTLKKEGRRMPLERIVPDGSSASKDVRIRSLIQSEIKGLSLNIRRDLMERDDNVGEEFRTYPKGHDDCLDSLSILLDIMPDCVGDNIPDIYMAMDPAFTKESYSDHTAIAVGTRYQGQAYLLDLVRFQTDDTDYICRILFNTYDKWNNMSNALYAPKKAKNRVGFRSRGSGGGRRRSKGVSFECDLTGFFTK